MIDLSIIIPFLNEEGNIPNLVSGLNEFIQNSNLSVEVIFVDDGSNDNSVDKLGEEKFEFEAKVIKLSQNFGSHAALRAGILNSKGKYTSFAYADLQDPISLQKKMYDLAENNNNSIVWGTREKTNNSALETLFSSMYARLMKRHVNPDFPLKGFDIVLFDEKVKTQLNKNIESNSSIFLQILNLGFTQETVYYTKKERSIGKSKWTYAKKIKLFIDSFVAFSYFPIRLVSIIGFLFFVIGITWTAYLVLRKFYLNDLVSGWPALISILMIGFGVTNIGLGIIAEYLWRTLDASRGRPVFIVDEIIKLSNNNED